MKEIDQLRNELGNIKFLKGIMEMPKERIKGTSFFPCGNGVFENSLCQKSIMILGQDQDNEKGFNKSMSENTETYSATWRNMIKLFNEAKINLKHCFFTNCLMGIRINSKRNVGKSPGLIYEEFLKENLNYLSRQIKIINPKSITILGLIPLKFLALLSNELRLKTTFLKSFREIDDNGYGYLESVKFEEIGYINIAILVHPSYRIQNCMNRKFDGMNGNLAEVEILKKVKNTGV